MTRKRTIALACLLALGLPGCGEQDSAPRSAASAADARASAAPAPSDQELLLHVKNALETQKDLDASQVDVSVSGGVVTLSGMVRGADERQKIVLLVAGVDGVQTVLDYLVLPTS
ncbi:MAG TPA: BON domain-containing protein [Burkholderiales bacterium]|nr:BON domain-containing protein [Burkholderiales bacterium]